MSTVIIITVPPPVIQAVDTALRQLPNRMDSLAARAMLFAIGLQESEFRARRQIINRGGRLVAEGPAKSFWQGEKTGGMCAGILGHSATRDLARALCTQHGIPATAVALWDAIEHNDVLAAACARLLLFTDPAPLPRLEERQAEEVAFGYYLRAWRPGAWDRGNADQRRALRTKWSASWAGALKAVVR